MINIYVYINLHHQRITLIILVTEWLWFPWIGTLLKELGRPRPQQWLRTDRFLRSPGMVVLQRIDVWSFFSCVCVSAHLLWIIIEYYRLIMTYRCSWSLNIPQDPQRSSQLACVDKCWQLTSWRRCPPPGIRELGRWLQGVTWSDRCASGLGSWVFPGTVALILPSPSSPTSRNDIGKWTLNIKFAFSSENL